MLGHTAKMGSRLETLREFYVEALSTHAPEGIWKDEELADYGSEPFTLAQAEIAYYCWVVEDWMHKGEVLE